MNRHSQMPSMQQLQGYTYEWIFKPRFCTRSKTPYGHLENLVFVANKLEHTRPHRGGFTRAIDRRFWSYRQERDDSLVRFYADAFRLEVRWRYRRKLKVRFLSPHHASVLARPIFLVSFPPIDIVMLPKTCSTHALIADLMRFSSLASSLRGWLRAPFSWIRLS